MKARWLILALLAGLGIPFVVPALAADRDVAVLDDRFDPATITIAVGDKVTWRDSAGGRPHNVRFEDGGLRHPPTPIPGPWSAERTFNSEGTYRYYCEAHGGPGGVGMAGAVVVGSGGTTTTQPTTTGPTNTTPEDVPPVLSGLRARPSSACTRRTRRCRRTRVGFEFSLSEAATVNGTVRKRGQRTRRFQREALQGENTVRFSTRGLAPGRWRLTLIATDQANHRSAPARTTFTVRR